MKTSEFIKYFEDEGYRVYQDDTFLSVTDEKDFIFINIRHGIDLVVDFTSTDLTFSEQQEYYKVIFEYLMTPLEEREEEEKYKLKQKGVSNKYLLWIPEVDKFTTGNSQYVNVESVFTQSEIDELPEYYKHPAVWEQIEVECEEE